MNKTMSDGTPGRMSKQLLAAGMVGLALLGAVGCAVLPSPPAAAPGADAGIMRIDPSTGESPDSIDVLVQQHMDSREIPGVSLAVMRGSEIVKVRAYGRANVELDAAAAPVTVFPYASIAKVFTGTAVLQLVQQGRFSIEDRIVDLLPPISQPGPAKPHRTPYESKFVEAGGVTLHYLDFGGEGLPLVFVHSESWDAYTFADFAPGFADRSRVLAITRPGYGESEAHPGGYDVASQAEALVMFLDALGIERAVFAGNSSPTKYMTYLAEHYPDRLAGLIYLAGLLPFWVQDIVKADPTGAGAMASRAVSGPESFERHRIQAAYRPAFLKGDRPSIEVPSLAFVARSGTIGHEHFNEALVLTGSELMAEFYRKLEPSPLRDYIRRPVEDAEYRTQTLERIQDPEVRTFFLNLADDAERQAEIWQYQKAVVGPALVAGQERFRRAFREDLQVIRLDVPVIHGYEYRDAPELIEPHVQHFLEEVREREGANRKPSR